MFGWHGRALFVDLSRQIFHTETIRQEILHTYLGGRGLGVRLMRDFYHLDPLAPEMALIFAAGPLGGTETPAADRISIVSRSPLTETIFDCPAGGRFARDFKHAGYDALIITGRSKKPVVLHVGAESNTLDDATKLWGDLTSKATARLSHHGSVAAIGPAGENRALGSAIVLNGNEAGRGGLGAVMGSKQLKAITVSGNRPVAVAEPDRFREAQQDIMRLFRASPVLAGEFGLARYGTATLVDLMSQRCMTPTENFRKTLFVNTSNYAGPAIRRRFRSGGTLFGNSSQGERDNNASGERFPGYEALSHFGALNRIDDLPVIIRAITLCTALGLDPVSTAATLAVWGEIRGRFVAEEELETVLHALAHREDQGEPLSLGARRMAEQIGQPEKAMTVKSLELPAYDPRGAYGLALSYCVSSRGGCHTRAFMIAPEILRKPLATDRFSFAGKGRIVKSFEDDIAAIDSLAACRYSICAAGIEEFAAVLSAVTGHDYTTQNLKQVGEQICLTERFYNQQNGFDEKDDLLPERFFLEPGSSNEEIEIRPLDRAQLLDERMKYYRIRGLDDHGRFKNARFLESMP